MQLLVNDVDILNNVNLLEAVYEDFATAQPSRLFLKFNDAESLWQNWKLNNEDNIRVVEKQCDTKALYAHNSNLSRGFCNILAKSIPCIAVKKVQKTYENVKLSKIAKDVANEIGFTIDIHYMTDHLYKSIVADNITLLSLLKKICLLEGIAIVFYNKTIILFDENKIENIDSTDSLVVENDDVFAVSNSENKLFNECVVKNNDINGKFKINAKNSNTLIFTEDTPATTVGEANRFAKGILRNINKTTKTGSVTTELKTEYAAGTVVNLCNSKLKFYNGKIFIYKVRHDFVNNKTKIFFRYIIEDY